MTIHCAISYFDSTSRTVGYLLGSDSAVIVSPVEVFSSTKSQINFEVDKSFRSRNTIGFIRGALKSEVKNDFASDCLDQIKSLDHQFDEIVPWKEYSALPLSNSAYTMMIGKKNDTSLELYTLSNMREKDVNKAILLHSLTSQAFYVANETTTWYAPFNRDYLVVGMRDRFNFLEAKNHIKKLLTSTALPNLYGMNDYKPGQPNVFVLNFQGIHKIEN